MTDCSHMEEKLSLYIDGELGPEGARLVESHLAGCGRCSALLADLRKTKELVGGLEEVEPPPWLTQKIMAGLTPDAEQPKGLLHRLFSPFHIKIPLEALAVCLVAVLAVYLYRATGPETGILQRPAEPPEVASGEPAAPEPKPGALSSEAKEERANTGAGAGRTRGPEKEKGFAPSPADKEGPSSGGTVKPPGALPAEGTAAPASPGVSAGSGAGGKMEKAEPLKAREAAPAPEQKAAPLRSLSPGREASPSPSAAPKQAERLKKAGSDRRSDGLSDALPRDRIVLRVEADRIKAAAESTENRLRRLGAKRITRESHGDFEIFEAELPARDLETLRDDLSRTFGVIENETAALDGSGGMRAIRVEIRANRQDRLK